MSEFDNKARDWDKNLRNIERSEAIAKAILKTVPLHKNMKALEYGAGTALLSFILKDKFDDITLMDNSREMTQVAKEKIAGESVKNMKPLLFDLEKEDFNGKFDIIYTQMVLHHVGDVDAIFNKFRELLNMGGYLAIADLYPEDGSFHGDGFDGHLGFDVEILANKLNRIGFKNIRHHECYILKKEDEDGNNTSYPIFLLTASR
ncbi:MAG TPA: class I SAM-dependent methyltransferase [Bacteroidales bacterium]|jgi:tRNA (cmo5U34)-methyltransferase